MPGRTQLLPILYALLGIAMLAVPLQEDGSVPSRAGLSSPSSEVAFEDAYTSSPAFSHAPGRASGAPDTPDASLHSMSVGRAPAPAQISSATLLARIGCVAWRRATLHGPYGSSSFLIEREAAHRIKEHGNLGLDHRSVAAQLALFELRHIRPYIGRADQQALAANMGSKADLLANHHAATACWRYTSEDFLLAHEIVGCRALPDDLLNLTVSLALGDPA